MARPDFDKKIDELKLSSLKQIKWEVLSINQKPFSRLPPQEHQKYDIVWADEKNFSEQINWKVALDEMIRLLGETGYIVIKYSYDHWKKPCNVISIKSFLGRRLGLEVSVVEENPHVDPKNRFDANTEVTSIFKIKRTNLKIYKDKLWSFCLLTQGNKQTAVAAFCKSIRDQDTQNKHEIIICGPEDKSLSPFNVRYIDHLKYRDKYGEICAKKNDLIKTAKNQNILIAHDRFKLNADFLDGFEKFGYDFDQVGIKQNYNDGIHEVNTSISIPSIMDLIVKENYNFNFTLKSPKDMDSMFVGGGLMIFKKDIVEKITFNELIFWSQAEDVELGKLFLEHKLPVRLNPHSSSTTFIDYKKPKYGFKAKVKDVLNTLK